MSSSSGDICYICLSDKPPLVVACDECDAPVHQKCINEQVRQGNNECGKCREELDYNKVDSINYNECGKDTLMGIVTIFYWIITLVGLPLLGLGKSVADFEDGGIGTIFMTIGFSALFLQCPPCCGYTIAFNKWIHWDCQCIQNRYYEGRYKNVVTMLILALFQILVILISHCIGYPIILWVFDINEFFTWRTSMAGYVCILILIIGVITILIFVFWCRDIIKKQYGKSQVNVICREADV